MARLTRKDFVATAKRVRESEMDAPARERLAKGFADDYAGSNPRFDRGRFLDACKPQQD